MKKRLHGHAWAWNVFCFVQWTLTATYAGALIVLATVADALNADKRPTRSVGCVGVLSDLGIALVCAAYGHFFYAALTLVQQTLESILVASLDKKVSAV